MMKEEIVYEVTKGEKRYRYPWDKLEVGDYFIIDAGNEAGVNNRRQLLYAANKAAKRKNLPNRYKCQKGSDGAVTVFRTE